MKRSSTLLQPLSHAFDDQTVSEHSMSEVEYLKVFVPAISQHNSGDLLMAALSYIEQYQGNVLQLELETTFLSAALFQAWRQEKYDYVVRLTQALSLLVGRLDDLAQAEQILHVGIEASRRIQDRQHLIFFLNRLGILLFSHGKYQRGRRIWRLSQRLARASTPSSESLQPFACFTQIADILGNYTAAQQFVETHLTAENNLEQDGLIVALFVRGLYARFMQSFDSANHDFSRCLHLLSNRPKDTWYSIDLQIFTLAVQAELARVQEHYARSQQYTETALSLAQVFGDRYTVASLLIDQGLYTYQQGQYADMFTAFQRLRNLALQLEVPHFFQCSSYLEKHLAQLSPRNHDYISVEQKPLPLVGTPVKLHQILSDREIEVLQLVAEGLTNQEIASLLVITRGTVKKHLEHIYTKLDVRCRTSAIAIARKHRLLA